ncbi:hypothetical protein HPT25_28200 [Bacillus sp. BRMEA1]|uniref:hypothetical protein n=1 Tax=Neobacillus endophyticus TaxID=2738405 RepID=UPI0015672192|nr:hypothetical protein [Neobacillus endophyticus]NRD81177.1 hypothetical protein [Neobacillus endophyticus]
MDIPKMPKPKTLMEMSMLRSVLADKLFDLRKENQLTLIELLQLLADFQAWLAKASVKEAIANRKNWSEEEC